MQPPHFSCPSSSSSAHTSPYVTQFVQSLLNSAGFSKSSSQAIELLTEVFERYLLLLASTSKQHSNHVGRRVTVPCDVEWSMNEMGTSTQEVQRWFDQEGSDIAGRWLESEQHNGLAQNGQQSGLSYAFQLGEYQRAGKVPASDRGNLELHYREVEAHEREELEAIILQESTTEEGVEEELADDYDANNIAEHSPPPPYRSNASQESVSTQPPTYKRRKLSESSIEYVPFFFPDFPSKSKESRLSTSAQEAGAEFERERKRRVQMGEDKMELLNERNQKRQDQEAVTWDTLDMAPTSRRSTDDNWYSAVEFSSSTLAQQQSIDDFPESIPEDDIDEPIINRLDQESSHRIFANDYLALVSEAKSIPLTLLTPIGNTNIFNQRRGLASILSDPSKYVPTDTMFAAIDARPTATPFQPGPSLLITPPTTTNSAPTFTPIQASGRQLISTRTINNSLYPICKHRVPNNVLNASRYLSGGENGEIFRRVTRTLDPIPILDERHAERVFHGIQAPKDQLNENNSYLREALDVLKIKRAEEIKRGIENGSLEEQQSQFSLNTNRDKLRVKNGTLVQTWDWMARDYNDPILPGKKFRSGTAGVFISPTTGSNTNDVEQNQSRQRSQSIQFT